MTDRQVLTDVFDHCQCYPHVTIGTKTLRAREISLGNQAPDVHLGNQASEVSLCRPKTVFRKQNVPDVKPKEFKHPKQKQAKPAKQQVKATPAKQRVKAKPKAKRKRTQTKRAKANFYTPRYRVSPARESFVENPLSSDDDYILLNDHGLNELAKNKSFTDEQDFTVRKRSLFGPKIVYE